MNKKEVIDLRRGIVNSKNLELTMVVAASENNAIGKDGKIPWNLPTDLKIFSLLTRGSFVIMGRKTHMSIGKPLPGRVNIVITRNSNYRANGCIVVSSIEDALGACLDSSRVFIIGGDQIYSEFMPLTGALRLTRVHKVVDKADTFFHYDDSKWDLYNEKRYEASEKDECAFTIKYIDTYGAE